MKKLFSPYVLGFSIVLVCAIVFTSFIVFFQSRQDLRSAIFTKQETIAMLSAKKLETKIENLRELLSIQVNTEMMKNVVVPATAQAHAVALKKVQEYMDILYESTNQICLFALLNSEGTALYSNNPQAIGVNYIDRAYFQKAMKGIPTTTEPMLSRASGNPIFMMAEGIDVGDVYHGAVTITVDMNALSDTVLSDIPRMKNERAFIIDKSGLVLMGSVKENNLKVSLSDRPWVEAIKDQEKGTITVDWNDKKMIAAFHEVPLTDWKVIVLTSTDEADNPVNKLFWIILTVNILGIAVIFGAVGMYSLKRNELKLLLEKDKADTSNQLKSTFLANMSHEIRTPMNAILGFIQLFDRTNLNSKQKDYLKKIEVSTETLLCIINDILDISKIESGKIELEKIIFYLESTINMVSSIVGFKIREKHLNFFVEIDENVPKAVIGDPTRLHQIFLNLLNNAVKFTHSGSITLAISVGSIVDSQVVLECSISDTGIGMSKEQQARLFKPFMQADNSVVRKYGGTGLGLSICKQLVELMNGTISVSAAENEGSVFSFTVQLNIPTQTELRKFEEEVAFKEESQNKHARKISTLEGSQLLVVDDNDINLEIATALLEGIGMKVDTAENGKEAIEKILTQKYALVFMDMQMPEMDGMEATQIIRAEAKNNPQSYFAKLPIIAMTANAMEQDKQVCLDAGMNAHIGKPINTEALHAMLLHWL